MGLLVIGTPLAWKDAKKHIEYVKEHGITQFLHLWHKLRDRTGDCLFWGDEVEYMVVSVDDKKKTAKVSLRGPDILEELQKEEEIALKEGRSPSALWRPEYAAYMIESTPGHPYGHSPAELVEVERNIHLRREAIMEYLLPNERVVTLCAFPRMGVGHFTDPPAEPMGPVALSYFTPDTVIHPHPRFATLTANIRERKGKKVEINVPVFQDTKTIIPLPLPKGVTSLPASTKPTDVYMDSMAFGMGCSCLQCTFQGANLDETRRVYDQLGVFAPIMLALTAATPIFRGYLVDEDARWNVISASVDDRTDVELGLKSEKGKYGVINKSRYDAIDSYLHEKEGHKYNDVELVVDEEIVERLKQEGLDPLMANHIGHLFIRDPLVIFGEAVKLDDEKRSDHFENIQSTNWQSVRFKPPPPESDIGWRLEFRTMEVQITDFENAAYVVFIALLTRVILSFDLEFYLPISLVDANMERAHERDALRKQKFWFRKTIAKAECEERSVPCGAVGEMTLEEIFCGSDEFVGIMTYVERYLDTLNLKLEHRCHIERYLKLIRDRLSGKLLGTAAWIRKFVQEHPDYKHDSVVSEVINYDLVRAVQDIQEGTREAKDLLGCCRAPCPTC